METIEKKTAPPRLRRSDLETAAEVKSFLEKKYNENYTIDQLARKFNINRLKLIIAFKHVARENIHEYVSRLRVDNSKEHLEETEMPIKQIAKRIGLDKSNYIIQFKKFTGKTPTQWRRDSSSCNEPGF